MSCPFDTDKCSGGTQQRQITLPVDGKALSIQPKSRMGGSDMCYFEIGAGSETEKATDDALIITEIKLLQNIRVSAIIAKSLKDPFVDDCYNIIQGESIFLRHPYKLFLLLESRSRSISFLIQSSYI